MVAAVKLPGPPSVREALVALDDDEAERVIPAVAAATVDQDAALLQAVTGVVIDGSPPPRADQLRLAARLTTRSRPSIALARLAQRFIEEPVVAPLLDEPSDTAGLQRMWLAYVSGASNEWAADFDRASAEIAQLFTVGMLERVDAGRPVEGWANVGVRRPSAEERASRLLADAPTDLAADLAGWCGVATWWGDVRRLTASAPTELRERAWGVWTELDTAFLPWLRTNYGTLLSSAAKWPTAVHRIAHFLARRLREGDVQRVLLIVLDGLGHAQWAHLRDRLPLDVVESGSTLALIPTYTTVSRQAIFAGDLPASSPDTLWTTQPEPRTPDMVS